MRGEDHRADNFFSYLRLEDRIAADHPLRAIREIVDAALAQLSRAFGKPYVRDGRPSIPPGASAAGAVAAGLLHGAVGTPAHGATQL